MATITDYTTLVQAVQEVNEDDGAEFLAYIPTAIDLAEERLYRELELPDLDQEFTGLLTSASPYVSKPAGFKIMNMFTITLSNGRKKFLIRKGKDYIVDFWPNATVTDEPKYYADVDTNRFYLAPTPNTSLAYTMDVSVKPTKLSATNLTNYYTTYCKDCLYYATLVEQAKFMKAWSQVAVWEQDLQRCESSWNIEAKRKRRDRTETPQNPDGGPNSLSHTVNSSS